MSNLEENSKEKRFKFISSVEKHAPTPPMQKAFMTREKNEKERNKKEREKRKKRNKSVGMTRREVCATNQLGDIFWS